MHIRKRLMLITLGTVLALVAGEILLQVVSFVAWMSYTPSVTEPARTGEHTVLCIGDSYTFGLGAAQPESECYPAELQRLIDERGTGQIRVVKDAWPSRDSREVLLRLGDQLQKHHPERVYVLVGMNDLWGRPTQQVQPEDLATDEEEVVDDSFPIRLRTARFVALIAEWLADRSPERPTDGPAFLGTWTSDVQEVTFFANGRMLFSPAILQWHEADDRIVITSGETELKRYRWQRDGDRLTLTSDGDNSVLVLERGTTSAEMIEQNAQIPIGGKPPGQGAASDPSGKNSIDPSGNRPIDALTKQLGPELIPKREVLAAHLELMIELCRKHNAVPVLLSYPWDVHGVRGVPEGVAKRTGVEFLSFLPHFERLLRSLSVEDLYIPDGHCTARGYKEMARMLLDNAMIVR